MVTMVSRTKSVWNRTFRRRLHHEAEAIARYLPQLLQQRFQRQKLQTQQTTPTTLARQHRPVQPHPHVTQQQRYRHQEQTNPRIPRTRPRTALVHLTVARLDAKTLTIQVAHLTRMIRTPAPIGVHQPLAAFLATPTRPVATGNADAHRGRSAPRRMQPIRAQTATPPTGEPPRSSGPLGMIGLASLERHRQQKRIAGRLQVTENLDAVKTAVQQQQFGSNTRLAGPAEQALENVAQRLALADIAQSERHALAVLDQVGGGVGVEVRGAALGLAAVEFVGLVKRLTVVRQQRQIDGQVVSAALQTGQTGAQGL